MSGGNNFKIFHDAWSETQYEISYLMQLNFDFSVENNIIHLIFKAHCSSFILIWWFHTNVRNFSTKTLILKNVYKDYLILSRKFSSLKRNSEWNIFSRNKDVAYEYVRYGYVLEISYYYALIFWKHDRFTPGFSPSTNWWTKNQAKIKRCLSDTY